MSAGNDNLFHSRWRMVLVGAAVALAVIIAQGTTFAAPKKKSLVNINTASQKELAAVKGVRRATAKKIIANRPYKSLEELSKAGLSPKQIQALKSSLTVGAAPATAEKKKGADEGIDGVIHFIDEVSGKAKRVVVQVKSGHVGVNAIRELKAVAADEAMGVFITLEPPTEPMKVEAIDAGYYHSPIWDKDYPKVQILTIEELLHGKTVDMPPQTQTSVTFAKAEKIAQKEGEQLSMED